jgi:hypothetical protein
MPIKTGSSGKRVPPIFFTRRREDAKTRRKRRRRTGIASKETAFFVLRPLGSRYCLRNFLVRHLTASSSFHLSVIGSFHFPGLHAFHCKLLAWNSVSKQHSTCLPEAPQNLFFCAAVEDGATASSRSSTSKNAASRANCPGTHWPEDPQNLFFCAAVEGGATATHWPEDPKINAFAEGLNRTR